MIEEILTLIQNGQRGPLHLLKELMQEYQTLRESCCNNEVEIEVLQQETEYLGTQVQEMEKTITNLQLSLASANRAVLQLRARLEDLQNPQAH